MSNCSSSDQAQHSPPYGLLSAEADAIFALGTYLSGMNKVQQILELAWEQAYPGREAAERLGYQLTRMPPWAATPSVAEGDASRRGRERGADGSNDGRRRKPPCRPGTAACLQADPPLGDSWAPKAAAMTLHFLVHSRQRTYKSPAADGACHRGPAIHRLPPPSSSALASKNHRCSMRLVGSRNLKQRLEQN
jgi:hypothetical protein